MASKLKIYLEGQDSIRKVNMGTTLYFEPYLKEKLCLVKDPSDKVMVTSILPVGELYSVQWHLDPYLWNEYKYFVKVGSDYKCLECPEGDTQVVVNTQGSVDINGGTQVWKFDYVDGKGWSLQNMKSINHMLADLDVTCGVPNQSYNVKCARGANNDYYYFRIYYYPC